MKYIIPTEREIIELNRIFMTFDNSEVSLEFCLNKVRMLINEYALPNNIILIISDIMLGVCPDKDFHNRVMNVWNALIIQIYYYIIYGDFLLPIVEFKLTRNDLVIITGG